ncbi:hypothetical protein OY671_011454, partial [Metschnikowia pulcherrima]
RTSRENIAALALTRRAESDAWSRKLARQEGEIAAFRQRYGIDPLAIVATKMKQKSGPDKAPAEQVSKDIRRQTRRQYSAEEKIRIVSAGLRGEEHISELCRREGIAASMYYGWSKE